MTLKQAHQRLAQTGAVVQLIPGDPQSALSRSANHLGGTQLMIVTEEWMGDRDPAWFYVPRMLAPVSAVYLASNTAMQASLTRLQPEEIHRRAATKAAA